MKVDKKYSPLLFGVIVSAITGFAMSFVITLINVGAGPSFPAA